MHFLRIFQISIVLSLEINNENIEEHLNRKNFSFILFFAPWLKSCDKVVNVISEVKSHFEGRDDVFIGKIDLYRNLKLGSRFRIEEYCSLKFFVKGSEVPERLVNICFVILFLNNSFLI